MANVTQEILLLIRAKDEATKEFQAISKSTKELTKTFQGIQTNIEKDQLRTFAKLSNTMDIAKLGSMGLRDSFRLSLQQMQDMKKLGLDQQLPTLARVGFRFRELTHGMRGFRMELLSVMFFGMGLQRMFGGLLQPALEASGIFEIWSTILEVLFLPVALLLLPVMLGLMDTIMGFPPELQTVIGLFVLFGAALGAVMFFIGQTGLGLGGLTMAFAKTADESTKAGKAAKNAASMLPPAIIKSNQSATGLLGTIVKLIGAVLAVVVYAIGGFKAIGRVIDLAGIDLGKFKVVFEDVGAAIASVGIFAITGAETMVYAFLGAYTIIAQKGQQLSELLTAIFLAPFTGGAGIQEAANKLMNGIEFQRYMAGFTDIGQKMHISMNELALSTKQSQEGVDNLGEEADDVSGTVKESNKALDFFTDYVGYSSDSVDSFSGSVDLSAIANESYAESVDITKNTVERMRAALEDANMSTDYAGYTLSLMGDEVDNTRTKFSSLNNQLAATVGGGGATTPTGGISMSGGYPTGEVGGGTLKIPTGGNLPWGGTATKPYTWTVLPSGEGYWKAMQYGGIVTKPTRALIGEAGPEAVIPLSDGKAGINVSPTYNINASVSSDMDIRKLASRLNDLLVSDYRRLSFR